MKIKVSKAEGEVLNWLKRWYLYIFGHQCYICGEIRLSPNKELCSYCNPEEHELKKHQFKKVLDKH